MSHQSNLLKKFDYTFKIESLENDSLKNILI